MKESKSRNILKKIAKIGKLATIIMKCLIEEFG